MGHPNRSLRYIRPKGATSSRLFSLRRVTLNAARYIGAKVVALFQWELSSASPLAWTFESMAGTGMAPAGISRRRPEVRIEMVMDTIA